MTGVTPGVTPGMRPVDLVPGDPDEVDRLAARLGRIAVAAGDAAARLRTLDGTAWTGESAALFTAAVGDVPVRLDRAAAAFGAAGRALTGYAAALREGQAAAAEAVRMVERSSPETLAADREAAATLVARAGADVEAAGRLAAERLARAEADAPPADDAGPPATTALRVVAEPALTDPEGYVSAPGDWSGAVAEMRYTAPHDVPFAGPEAAAAPGTGEAGWQTWAGERPDRATGVLEAGTVAAAGAAVAAGVLIGRRRDRTALGLVGLDEAELRRRRDEFGGARHRNAAPAAGRTARLRDTRAWRTRLVSEARLPGTVQHWTGPGADPLPRSRVLASHTGSVDRDVRGAVLRTGRPAHEGS